MAASLLFILRQNLQRQIDGSLFFFHFDHVYTKDVLYVLQKQTLDVSHRFKQQEKKIECFYIPQSTDFDHD